MNGRALSLLSLFPLTERTQFAVKVGVALTLSFLIPFSLGWGSASTAATTVIVIAAGKSFDESVVKGLLRIVGTLSGAAVGIALIAWLPQDRELYLALLSLFVALFLYLGYAYQGDKTIFMLSALTMMIVFKGGDTQDLFLYGVDRTLMTVLGVVIFMMVGVLLWPPKGDKRSVTESGIPEGPKFLFFDPDHLRGTLVSMLIFYTAVAAWILFNPPGGFFLVTLATAMSLYTAFSPVAKPHLLIFVYTLTFLFATVAYVAVLPHLHHAWELALFLFAYAFLMFRLFPVELAMFLAMGLLVMNIQNQMFYHFGIFLNTLLLFYGFMFLLLLFYYLPYSTRPEKMTVRLAERFGRLAERVTGPAGSPWQRFWRDEAAKMLPLTATKLQMWAKQVDVAWHGLEADALNEAARKAAEAVAEWRKSGNASALEEAVKNLEALPLKRLLENGRF